MPFFTIYLPYGLDDAAIAKSCKEITMAGDALLENTLARMIRVTIYEYQPHHCYEGGKPVQELSPVVQFRVGPGRSDEAKDELMRQVTDILSTNLNCKKENVRAFILDNNGPEHHFTIDGKPKDFSKKVK